MSNTSIEPVVKVDAQDKLDSLLELFSSFNADLNISINYLSDQTWIFSTFNQSLQIQQYEFDLISQDLKDLWNEFFSRDHTFSIFCNDLKELYKSFEINNLICPASILDVMLAGFIQNSNLSFDLESQAVRNLEAKYLTDLKSKLDTSKNNEKVLLESIICLNLGIFYKSSFTEKLFSLWQNIESPLAVILAKMELKGVYIKKDKLKSVSNELETSANELQNDILLSLDSPNLNLNSPAQLGKVLVEKGFKLKVSASGKISTDRAVLEDLEGVDTTGVIAKVLEYRTLSKLFSTYTDSFLKLLDSDDRIHCTYNQVQAATGRLSSNNPNLQNIPIRNPKYGPLIRSTFASPKDRCIIAADYSQMELRLLAHYCKDPVLLDAFEKNQDIHARTSAEIFEIPLHEVTKEMRRIGKTLNFALLYQQGSQATAKQLGIKTKEAAVFIEKYFSRFAKVKPFIEQVLEKARLDGYVETYFGRRRYFENLNSENLFQRKIDERAAFNAVLQGSNADLIKLAMINLDRSINNKKIDAYVVLQVHDELVVECDKKCADEVKDLLIKEMQVNQILNVPILVEAGIGQNWAEAK